jgi:hypothetical protein
LVARTFLTAKGLLKPQFLPDHINIESTILVTLELLQELSTLDSEIKDFLEKEKKVIAEYRAHIKKQESFVIPSLTDVLTRCKTIFQKSDHIYQILVEIIKNFYPNGGLSKQSHITTIYDLIKSIYGENDPFSKFIEDNIHFFETIRDIRDCLDHRLPNIKIMNFELHISSCVITPTIEMDFRGVKLERQSLSSLLPYIYKTFIKLFETIFVYLCDKNAKQNLMQYRVTFIPLERRINKLINYSFWSPIGDGGYFYL